MWATTKFGSLLLAGILTFGAAGFGDTAAGRYDSQIRAEISKQLQKSEFKNVQSSVADGVVTLQGSVDTYKHKLDAEKKARKADHVQSVRDLLQVSTSAPDIELRDRLAKSLRYDRYGYDSLFNVLTVGVTNGVVTLGGEVRTPVDAASALDIVQSTPGVKGVVDQLKVAPTSIFDDNLRLRLARAIYRDPVLSKYALDPQAPIRILVNNGNVGLYGTVDNKMDSQLAYLRANSVFGAFSVENHLSTAQATR